MLACVCVIADGPELELGAEYCEHKPEIPNTKPELPEDFEYGKFNLIL
jgi:hypothetical protein